MTGVEDLFMKKKFIAIVVGLALFAIAICYLPFSRDMDV